MPVHGRFWKEIFFLFLVVLLLLLLFFTELEHIAIEYAMKRKFMEGRIMSNWGKFNTFII